MRPDELERRLQERLDALGAAPRAELLHVLILPDFERADMIGEFYRNPKTRTFAETPDCLLTRERTGTGTPGVDHPTSRGVLKSSGVIP